MRCTHAVGFLKLAYFDHAIIIHLDDLLLLLKLKRQVNSKAFADDMILWQEATFWEGRIMILSFNLAMERR